MTSPIVPGPFAPALDAAGLLRENSHQLHQLLFAVRGARERAWFFSADDCGIFVAAEQQSPPTDVNEEEQRDDPQKENDGGKEEEEEREDGEEGEKPPPPPPEEEEEEQEGTRDPQEDEKTAAPPPPPEEAEAAMAEEDDAPVDLLATQKPKAKDEKRLVPVTLIAGCRGIYVFREEEEEKNEAKDESAHSNNDTSCDRSNRRRLHMIVPTACVSTQLTRCRTIEDGKSVDILALACSQQHHQKHWQDEIPVSLALPWKETSELKDEEAKAERKEEELTVVCSVATATALTAVLLAVQIYDTSSEASSSDTNEKLSSRIVEVIEKQKASSSHSHFVPDLRRVLLAFGEYHDGRKQRAENKATREGEEEENEQEEQQQSSTTLKLPDPVVTPENKQRWAREAQLLGDLKQLCMLEEASRDVIGAAEEQARNGVNQTSANNEEEAAEAENLSPFNKMHKFVSRFADTVHDPAMRGAHFITSAETSDFSTITDDFAANKRRLKEEEASRHTDDLLQFETRLFVVGLARDADTLVLATEPAARVEIEMEFYRFVADEYTRQRCWLERALLFWKAEAAGRVMAAANERSEFGDLATQFALELRELLFKAPQKLRVGTPRGEEETLGATARTEAPEGDDIDLLLSARRSSGANANSKHQQNLTAALLPPSRSGASSRSASPNAFALRSYPRPEHHHNNPPKAMRFTTNSPTPTNIGQHQQQQQTADFNSSRRQSHTERSLFAMFGHPSSVPSATSLSSSPAVAVATASRSPSTQQFRSASAFSVGSAGAQRPQHIQAREQELSTTTRSARPLSARSAGAPPSPVSRLNLRGTKGELVSSQPSTSRAAVQKPSATSTPRTTMPGSKTPRSAGGFSGRKGGVDSTTATPRQQYR